MANALIPQKTLRMGVDEALYVTAAGAFNTTGTCGTAPVGCFGIPPQCSNYRGSLWLMGVPVGGTVTAATFKLEASLDGVNFNTLQIQFPVTGATVTFSSYLTLNLDASHTPLIRLDVSGLGGHGFLRLNATTMTLGTGSGFNVYAHIG